MLKLNLNTILLSGICVVMLAMIALLVAYFSGQSLKVANETVSEESARLTMPVSSAILNEITTTTITTLKPKKEAAIKRAFLKNAEFKQVFEDPSGLFMNFVSDGKSSHFVTDPRMKCIRVFDDKWTYKSSIVLQEAPYFVSASKDKLFVSTDNGMLLYNMEGKQLRSYLNGAQYRGSYYDEASKHLYVSNLNLSTVQLFSVDLDLLGEIYLLEYMPYRITSHNGKLYIASQTDILVMEYSNNTLDAYMSTQCKKQISSVLIDEYERMAVLCRSKDDFLYLYDTRGAYLHKSFAVYSLKNHVGFDLNNRLTVLTDNQIYLLT